MALDSTNMKLKAGGGFDISGMYMKGNFMIFVVSEKKALDKTSKLRYNNVRDMREWWNWQTR
jgi:hypothetical protein